jgi:hypothetical protein
MAALFQHAAQSLTTLQEKLQADGTMGSGKRNGPFLYRMESRYVSLRTSAQESSKKVCNDYGCCGSLTRKSHRPIGKRPPFMA